MKIGVIGSRELPEEYKGKVLGVVKYLVDKGYKIHSGGALGADQYVLEALLILNSAKKGVIFSAWSTPMGFPKAVRKSVNEFIINSGEICWGSVPAGADRPVVVAGLLGRNERLVNASSGVIAFLCGESRGSRKTVIKACEKGLRVVVFLCGDNAVLPAVAKGKWKELDCPSPWDGAYLYEKEKQKISHHHRQAQVSRRRNRAFRGWKEKPIRGGAAALCRNRKEYAYHG